MSDEVLAMCPFCQSGLAMVAEAQDHPGNYNVMCPECGACGPLAHDRAGAPYKWNWRRALGAATTP